MVLWRGPTVNPLGNLGVKAAAGQKQTFAAVRTCRRPPVGTIKNQASQVHFRSLTCHSLFFNRSGIVVSALAKSRREKIMYLLELELQNVRAIRNMFISFRSEQASAPGSARRWTVFLGENGCGKSTVLRAIGLVLGGSRSLYQFLDAPEAWVRKGAKSAAIRALVLLPNGKEHLIELEFDNKGWRGKKNSSSLELLDRLHSRPKRESVLAGYGAFRRPSDREHLYEKSGSRGPAGALASLFDPDAGQFGFEQWAIRLDYEKQMKGRQAIASTLNALLPGMSFKGINRSSGEVMMSTVDGDVPLRQLSEGYQAMAAWAGDLLFRLFNDKVGSIHEPRNARGILLLDEMDLHLHPIWKRKLVEFMEEAFPHLQVIATTHSPLAVQQCDEGELFVIRREADGPRLVPFVGNPSKLRLSDLFLSPLIGLSTLDSPDIEKLRDEARKIELKPGAPAGADRDRLKQILLRLGGTQPISDSEMGDFLRHVSLLHASRQIDALQRIDAAEKLITTSPKIGRKKVSPKSAVTVSPKRRLIAAPRQAPSSAKAKKLAAKHPGDVKVKSLKQAAKRSTSEKVAQKKVSRPRATAKPKVRTEGPKKR